MPNGFGRRGWGFGFRGSSPPWPFVGIGRGGLPRCGYFLSGAAGVPAPGYMPYPYPAPVSYAPYSGASSYFGSFPGVAPFYGSRPATSFYGGSPGATPSTPQMSREQELGLLKSQAESIKVQLEQIEKRMRELESEEE